MGAGYSFVTLDDEQKHLRRQRLDQYGSIAQISALLPLLVLQIYFLGAWVLSRAQQSSNLVPSSPVLKSQLASSHIREASTALRRFIWWCGDDVAVLGSRKGELLFGAAWAVWLLLLSFLQTGDDYLHITKRLGIVAASQLPFHYLLAVKTPYSPLQLLTHASHETLNAVHQILGRIVTALMLSHVILYLNFYVQSGILQVRLQEAYVICGLTSIILFALLNTSSLAGIRRTSYRIFLAVHILFSLAVLPLLYFHVHHIRIYIYETVAVLILNLILRGLATQSASTASISIITGTQLVDISIPVEPRSVANKWMPGQHAYLSLPGHPLKAALAKNPFTLSSVPATDHRLRFIARIQKGNTALLASAAKSTRILLEGPYGVTTHPDTLLTCDCVLLIAGGIGATFIMPLYRQLLTDLSPSAGSHRRQKVSAVWVARSTAETTWAVPSDLAEKEGFYERLRVFVTRSDDDLATDGGAGPFGKLDTQDGEAIELEERAELLSKQEPAVLPGELPLYAGRPDLARLVDQAFSGSAKGRVAVMVCGPPSLGAAVRAEVGRWVYRGRDVFFWDETFNL